ncbi:MAG: hypothetical protein WCH40_09990, partial [Verrucomicrobiales bacterium]
AEIIAISGGLNGFEQGHRFAEQNRPGMPNMSAYTDFGLLVGRIGGPQHLHLDRRTRIDPGIAIGLFSRSGELLGGESLFVS